MRASSSLSKKIGPYSFLLIFVCLYSIWYFINEYRLFGVKYLDDLIVQNLVDVGVFVLDFLGFQLIDFSKYDGGFGALGIDGSSGILIGNPCNGLSLFVLFSVFIVAYPSRLTDKLMAIPIGIFIIHVLNIVRIVSLSLIAYYSPESLLFNHTYTFTGLMYLIIFGLWYIWVQKLTTHSNKPA